MIKNVLKKQRKKSERNLKIKIYKPQQENGSGEVIEDASSIENKSNDIVASEPVMKMKKKREYREEVKSSLGIKRYKIQEAIKPGQVILIQVIKEERGPKGAALTTFISFGR